jgi:hypothetical protein
LIQSLKPESVIVAPARFRRMAFDEKLNAPQ